MTDHDLAGRLDGIVAQLDKADEDRRANRRRMEHIEAQIEDLDDRVRNIERLEGKDLWQWLKENWGVLLTLTGAVPAMTFIFGLGLWEWRGHYAIQWLRDEISQAAQNDEIIFQPPGLSFVREPVKQGDAATYVLVAKRNPAWLSCTYITQTPVFTDEIGRSVAGSFTPRGRQYGSELVRTELELQVPPGLAIGRVTVVLQIVYDCAGQRLTHNTYPVAFELKPGS